jgi:hypothetical protein
MRLARNSAGRSRCEVLESMAEIEAPPQRHPRAFLRVYIAKEGGRLWNVPDFCASTRPC